MATSLQLGASTITKVMRGVTEISRIYVGPTLTFDSTTSSIDPNLFAFTVDATRDDSAGTGTAANLFHIPSSDTSYQIQWEEVGNAANNSGGVIQVSAADYVIDFGAPGIYQVLIDPVTNASNFKRFRFAGGGDKLKMISVEQWGTTAFDFMANMFEGCTNFTGFTAQDVPVLSAIYLNSLTYTFKGCSLLSVLNNISAWPMSTVQQTKGMFQSAPLANPSVGPWDVSSVQSMYAMFYLAGAANPDITSWTTTALTNTGYMFNGSALTSKSFANFNVSSLATAASMLAGRTLTTADYDATLIAWAAQTPQTGVAFHGGNSTYSSAAQAAHDTLTTTYSWVITDWGSV